MGARLAIGDFSRMTHVSIRALRHYHELGVLVPAVIDPASGYRFYEPGQVALAQVIRRFRDLGMPLEEIREMLRAPDVQARNRIIAAHLRRMEAELALTQSAVTSLRSLLEGRPSPLAVEHRAVGLARALAITGMVSMPELDDWWTEAFGELDATLAAAGVPPAGPRAALYPADLFQVGTARVTAYIPVDEVPGGGWPTGPAALREIPRAELAVAVHRGALADVDLTYGALGSYVAEREIGLDGPIREIYLVTAFETPDQARHVTEVGWPVFQTAAR
jgi:DNA-binding transcriptional MerR regulator/effector-binding domain-containing protein